MGSCVEQMGFGGGMVSPTYLPRTNYVLLVYSYILLDDLP
jgi:hypothetical protein